MKYVRFYGGNGYCGCDYEYYEEFPDDIPESELNIISQDYAYENAESFEYVVTGWGESWESPEDRDDYYDSIFDYCGWDYCSQEEFEENN